MNINEETIRIREHKPSILPAVVWSSVIASLISFAIAWGIVRRLHPGITLSEAFSSKRHVQSRPAITLPGNLPDNVSGQYSRAASTGTTLPNSTSPSINIPKASNPGATAAKFRVSEKPATQDHAIDDNTKDTNPQAATNQHAPATVPQLKDLSEADARALLTENQLSLVVDGEVDSATVKGHIALQKPLSGTQLPAGSEVHVMVAAGLRKIRIPNIIGLDTKAAKKTLADAGLNIDEITYAKTGSPGKVVGTEPPVGSLTLSTDAIQIIAGPGVKMPRLIGRSPRSARQKLRAVGLRITRTRYSEDEDRGLGVILRQTPVAGKIVTPNTPVIITVNAQEY